MTVNKFICITEASLDPSNNCRDLHAEGLGLRLEGILLVPPWLLSADGTMSIVIAYIVITKSITTPTVAGN